ncbi:MAG: NUDIX hydrolase [Clostridia bacterium]|nr:NUDIX hydrolase [Clostridia bacterium]
MAKINKIVKQTNNRFLNMYSFNVNNKGKDFNYFVTSRAEDASDLKVNGHMDKNDGVAIFATLDDKLVLIKQLRYSINDYIYEFPAGLVEPGESEKNCAIREFYEETGLTFTPIDVDPMFEKPRFTSIGLTDETTSMVYGFASGTISNKHLDGIEDIEVVLVDRAEAQRILKEENVSVICAYHLIHYIKNSDPFYFLK